MRLIWEATKRREIDEMKMIKGNVKMESIT
jgi:hypothetical protein